MPPEIVKALPERVNAPAVLLKVIEPTLERLSLVFESRVVPENVRLLAADGTFCQLLAVDQLFVVPVPFQMGSGKVVGITPDWNMSDSSEALAAPREIRCWCLHRSAKSPAACAGSTSALKFTVLWYAFPLASGEIRMYGSVKLDVSPPSVSSNQIRIAPLFW